MTPDNIRIDLDSIVNKPYLRLGIISDTHNELNKHITGALENCDVIVHAGDIGDTNILKQLNQISPHVFPVRGNNDTEYKWPSDGLAALAEIPEYLELQFHNQIIGLIHGHQYEPVRKRHDKLRAHFPDADIVIYGHSHRLVFDQEQQPWVINPGAAGYTRTFGGASCIVAVYDSANWSIEACTYEKNKPAVNQLN